MTQFHPLLGFRVRKVIALFKSKFELCHLLLSKNERVGGRSSWCHCQQGVDKLADVIVLALVPFACDMVAVLSAAVVGTVIFVSVEGADSCLSKFCYCICRVLSLSRPCVGVQKIETSWIFDQDVCQSSHGTLYPTLFSVDEKPPLPLLWGHGWNFCLQNHKWWQNVPHGTDWNNYSNVWHVATASLSDLLLASFSTNPLLWGVKRRTSLVHIVYLAWLVWKFMMS